MHPRVIIIGSGFGGLSMAIRLRRAGIDSFTILEKAGGLGGTWRDNTYPGAACDSPSFLYCFSFEQKTDWSRKWAPQPEILAYMEHCARKYDLLRHVRFDTEVVEARFDAEAGVWRVRTTGGQTLEAEVLVSSVGQLNRPSYPHVPGLDRFRGVSFHSARWEHQHDLRGKNVAVIGNAASAIQLIPCIQPAVKRLSVFQRSANWMIPKREALGKPNVDVVTSPIDRVSEGAIVTRDGRTIPADVVILATGFETTTFLVPMRIVGPDGRVLEDVWRAGAEAYLGMTVAGFPNFFMLYGPNTNLGHNSIIFMLECQVRYVMSCIAALTERDLTCLDVRPEAMAAYNARLQAVLERTVWARTGKSWYKRADGRITNNWSGTTVGYWWRTRRVELDDYRQQGARAGRGGPSPR